MAYDQVTDRLYLQDAVDGSWFMHQVDLTTGQDTGKSSAVCGFGFAMSDLTALEKFNTKEEPGMMAVSQTYLMSACDPMGNTFNQGWNLAQYLTEYTGGAKFVAVASMGTETNEDGVLCDLVYALDDAGWLWGFEYDGTGLHRIQLHSHRFEAELPHQSELPVLLHGARRRRKSVSVPLYRGDQ